VSSEALSRLGIETASVDREVTRTGLAIIRPSQIFADLCEAARADYLAAFRSTRAQPPKKVFAPADLAVGPWRKFTIGSKNGVGESYAQLLQTIYFDSNQPGHASLNTLFKVIIELRNQLMRVAPGFGEDPARDGFWNACRVHHYPTGGGFMLTHRDTYFPIKLGDLPFYQVMAPLSLKGRDFSEGGGVLVTRQGERLNTDEIAGLGSIVVFDGKVEHGVDDVDPQDVMNFEAERGRLAAFANLYVSLK
jgi:hypothetical protein